MDAVANDEYYKRYLPLFYFTLFFGLRREEVLGIKWSSINFYKKELHITSTVTKGTRINRDNTTKTKKSNRFFLLDEEHTTVLKKIRKKELEYRKLQGKSYFDSDYIFKNEDGTLFYPNTPSKAFRRFINKHKELPQGITFHGLRKSWMDCMK